MRIRNLTARIDVSRGLDACWLWTGSLVKGYAQAWDMDTKTGVRVHRVLYKLIVGPIGQELTLDHLCRVRACVNPGHLEPVTAKLNVLRGNGCAAWNAKKTHCYRGHEFTMENTYDNPDGSRECYTCKRFAWRRTRLLKAAGVLPS